MECLLNGFFSLEFTFCAQACPASCDRCAVIGINIEFTGIKAHVGFIEIAWRWTTIDNTWKSKSFKIVILAQNHVDFFLIIMSYHPLSIEFFAHHTAHKPHGTSTKLQPNCI